MTDASEWRVHRLGNIVENVNEYYDRSSTVVERYVAGDHIDEGSLSVRRWGLTSDEIFPPTFNRRFRSGDVLFHSRNLRKLAQPAFDGVTGEKLFVLRVHRPDVLMPALLPFVLQATRFNDYVNRMWAGSTNKFLNQTPLMNYELALPPLNEQQRFADALKATQDLEECARALATSTWVVRESWLDQEFDALSQRWPKQAASDLTNRITVGIVVRPADLYVTDGFGVPALRSLNVLPNRVLIDNLVHISQEGHAQHKKSRLLPGDLVIVRSGRPGDAAVIPPGLGEMNCIDLIICSPSAELLPNYLCAVLNSRFGRRQFAAGTAGTAQKHFNVGVFKKLVIPVPPSDVQARIVDQLEALTHSAIAAERRLDDLSTLRSALMQGLFAA